MQKITFFKKKTSYFVRLSVPFLDAPMLAMDARFVYFFRNGNLKGFSVVMFKITEEKLAF